MTKVKVKKKYRTIIISKDVYNTNRMPSLTVIRRKAKIWNLKEEDILDITEFTFSYHIKIKNCSEYNYDYSSVPNYKYYYRKHKNEFKEYSKKYYQEHKEEYKERNRRNYIKRKEKCLTTN